MKYIDADRLRAEIEWRIKKNEALYPRDQGGYWNDDESCAYDQNKAYIDLLNFVDSLQQEQPGVDLEKEIEREWQGCHPIDEGMGVETASIHIEAFDDIAHYFYELGLKAKEE